MLKKTIAGIIIGAASVSLLAGCASTDGTQTTTQTTTVDDTLIDTVESTETSADTAESTTATDAADTTAESTSSGETTAADSSSASSVAPVEKGSVKSDNVQVDITGYKVVMPGQEGAKNSLKPVVVFYYDVTNLSDKEIDANSAWTEVFDAYQNAAAEDRNILGTGIYVDESIPAENGTKKLKKDEKGSYYKPYELTDETTSITLKSHNGLGGAALGDDIVLRVVS